ncbi:GNAT family N-acetyltransferase [Nocardia sp. NBC_01730]|uniref:GNAT family N-acetyltransferase n=1 Tax=Nocardia sp. NBC_01730 TaxID=2975998 RepID=UPI002E15F8E2|nr:GNAT family N-acetyltransferase [Nocardia sp. NBC_01730]
MRSEHADQVLEIYQLGIGDGDATFETTAPTWREFDKMKLPHHRFVALDDHNQVLGWVAVVPVSDRCAYAGVVEHSVYVHPDARGHGAGLALHTKAGFRTIGTRQRIGRHHGRWRDVTLIERRSPTIE